MRAETRDRHADDTRIWAGPTKWWFIAQGEQDLAASPPRRLAAAVGEPADCMENVIQNHRDVVNRSGWTAGRATPSPVRRTGHPQNPPPQPSGCWTEGLLSTGMDP